AEIQCPAGAAGLDDVAVQPAGGVHRGDHALGGDVLAFERAGRAGALDLGDRDRGGIDGLLAVTRLLAIARLLAVTRVLAVARFLAAARLLAVVVVARQLPGGRWSGLEVGAVLAGRGDALDGGAVGSAR